MQNSNIPEVSFKKLKTLFGKKNFSVGWSFLWRMWILMLISMPLFIGFGVLFSGFISSAGSDYGTNLLYMILLMLGSLLISFAVFIPGSNYIGKKVIMKHYQILIKSFIGWKITWRVTVMGIAIYVVILILLIPNILLMYFMKNDSGIVVILALVYFVFLMLAYVLIIIASIAVHGWVIHRIIKLEENNLDHFMPEAESGFKAEPEPEDI